jgi:hypothetical protein
MPVTGDLFVDVCKHGVRAAQVVANELPVDATFIAASFDPVGFMVWLFVESDTFDEVPENQPVPEHPTPLFEVVRGAGLLALINE